MTQLENIAALARRIINSDASWETKYDLIFSDEISMYVRNKLGVRLDYCDPDSSYEEDVTAYVQALEDHLGTSHTSDCRGSHCSRCGSCDGGMCICYAR